MRKILSTMAIEKNTAHRFDKIAKIYNNPFFQFYYFWAHKSCLNFVKSYIKDNFKILDVACGTGIFLKKLRKNKELKLFGIDNSEKMISIANQHPNIINFKVGNVEKIPFEDTSFDLITIIDAFYYFQNKEKSLKECARVLKPNHYLFLFYPAIDILPKFILRQIKITSRLLFLNSEEYSASPNMKELEKMADTANLKLITNKIKMMHRFILFRKN